MKANSAQSFVGIKKIEDGIVLLSDNTLRGIIFVSSINYELLSEEDRKSVLYQFQDFLNSLDFPVQILVQSRYLNLTGYIDFLKKIEKKQKSDLLKIQAISYRHFIEELIGSRTIFAKNFFVVVSYNPPLSNIKGELSKEDFNRYKSQLLQRMEFVILGLRRCRLECAKLETKEVAELFWSYYHPSESEEGYYPEFPPELLD